MQRHADFRGQRYTEARAQHTDAALLFLVAWQQQATRRSVQRFRGQPVRRCADHGDQGAPIGGSDQLLVVTCEVAERAACTQPGADSLSVVDTQRE